MSSPSKLLAGFTLHPKGFSGLLPSTDMPDNAVSV